MNKPYLLFHSIGPNSEESAAVRKFIVDFNLVDQIEFLNVKYEGAQQRLIHLIGHVEAPVLVFGAKILRGQSSIISFLQSNRV